MRTPAAPPRARLLAAAVEYLQAHGLGDLSLRELAAAIGTSHRMLIYHFGSKEGLFVAVVQEADKRQRQLLANLFGGDTADFAASARRFWHQLRSPELAPLERRQGRSSVISPRSRRRTRRRQCRATWPAWTAASPWPSATTWLPFSIRP
jgi:AcrR family transcriptional regulator